MIFTLEEVVERAWLLAAAGQTEAEAALYRDEIATWLDLVFDAVGHEVARGPHRWLLRRSYVLPSDGAGGCIIVSDFATNAATPETLDVIAATVDNWSHDSGTKMKPLPNIDALERPQPLGYIYYTIEGNQLFTRDEDGNVGADNTLGGSFTFYGNFIPVIADFQKRQQLQARAIELLEQRARAKTDARWAIKVADYLGGLRG